jgi:tetratricopeptide (TPR) repeat protein
MKKMPNKLQVLLLYLFLALATFIAFEQTHRNDFINYDDYQYVTENWYVQKGIGLESVKWAFTTGQEGNWHPLTWLSHMLDCELFGLNPGWHHLTSVLFHIANTLLLFWVLKKMTDAIWPSLFVAAVFALHPLHVESVAWIAERKDVLSGLFWMLTIVCYIRYTEQPSIKRYLLVFVVFALGLMAKPMLVSLPFVLLLLDYWPLGRLQWGHQTNNQEWSAWRLVREKIPLFILTIASSVITFIVQQKGGAMDVGESYSLGVRISNALVCYIGYIIKMVYPVRLAVLYPHPGANLPMWQVIVSFLIIVVISAVVIYAGRRRRYLAVGWFWYLGTLVPVIGLVQVGAQAMADRYTYLPSIGIFIMVGWGLGEVAAKWRERETVLGICAGVVLAAFLICTRIQVRYWQDSSTLFRHTLEVTDNNYIMHNYYGRALRERGQLDESIKEIGESLRLNPNYAGAYNSLGITLQTQGKLDEAVKQFRQALRLNPDFAKVHNNLGIVLAKQGNLDEAIAHFVKAIELDAVNDKAHHNLAQTFFSKGDIAGAIKHYRESLRLNADSVETLCGLSWIFSTSESPELRDGAEAVRLAKRACELSNYRNPETLYTLAAAYAEMGRFSEAVQVSQEAIDLCLSSGKEARAEDIARVQKLYKSGQPYRGNQ